MTTFGFYLALVFVILKIVGAISWAWGWVLSPLVLSTVFDFVLLGVVSVIMRAAGRADEEDDQK